MNKTGWGSVAALIANMIFGFSFLFSKVALEFAHPLVILAVRFSVAFLILNILWAFGLIKIQLKGKPKKGILLMAIAQPLLYFIFELYGIEFTSSAISGVIISLVPVGVILISLLFLKEKPNLRQILFALLSLAAIAVISLLSNDGEKNYVIGILLLLGAVICAAVFNVLSRNEAEHYTPVERTYMMFLIGAVGFNLAAALGLGKSYAGAVVSAATFLPFWGAIGYLAILSSIGAFLLYNYATSNISSVRASSFSNIITVVSVLAGIFIGHEALSVPQLICCAVIIIGVCGVNYEKSERK